VSDEPIIIEPERYEFFERTPGWEPTRRDFFKIAGGGLIVALLVKDVSGHPPRMKSGPGFT
jgi:hypothetical protein